MLSTLDLELHPKIVRIMASLEFNLNRHQERNKGRLIERELDAFRILVLFITTKERRKVGMGEMNQAAEAPIAKDTDVNQPSTLLAPVSRPLPGVSRTFDHGH